MRKKTDFSGYCPYCGAVIESEEQVYCSQCGNYIERKKTKPMPLQQKTYLFNPQAKQVISMKMQNVPEESQESKPSKNEDKLYCFVFLLFVAFVFFLML
jgi:tRNA(Ile2) C34 agmatinyltransferase TiaS